MVCYGWVRYATLRLDMIVQDVFRKFETIGINCEFAFVQRRAGVEESGLLRWAFINSLSGLVKGLNNNFQDIYALENITPHGAKMVRDETYEIAFHSNLPYDERNVFTMPWATFKTAYRTERDKIIHLRDKTIENLKDGHKIFVYKHHRPTSEEHAHYIKEAMSRIGDCALLIVSPANEENPAGTVRKSGSSIYWGYIDRIAPIGRADTGNDAGWLEICTKVVEF